MATGEEVMIVIEATETEAEETIGREVGEDIDEQDRSLGIGEEIPRITLKTSRCLLCANEI